MTVDTLVGGHELPFKGLLDHSKKVTKEVPGMFSLDPCPPPCHVLHT